MQNSLFPEPNTILPFQGDLLYEPAFFTKKEADDCLLGLQTEIPWKQEPIVLFGKKIMQPRLTAWMGEKPYTYSGITMQPHPFGVTMKTIKNKLEAFTHCQFNTALLNLYRNGTDSMGRADPLVSHQSSIRSAFQCAGVFCGLARRSPCVRIDVPCS